jgi:hypothetical protein
MENLLVSMKASFARTMQWIIPVCLAALAGCVQPYPISYYASPGDTVVLGLGGFSVTAMGLII